MPILTHHEAGFKFEQRWVPPDHIPHLLALAPHHHVIVAVDVLPADSQVAGAAFPGQRLIALSGHYKNLAQLHLALDRELGKPC